MFRKYPKRKSSFGTLLKILAALFVLGVLGLVAAGTFFYYRVAQPPLDFPTQEFITIDNGSSLSSVATLFQNKSLITNADAFKALVYLTGRENEIKSGTYYFARPQDMLGLVQTVLGGTYNVPVHKVTIFEGEAAYKFAPRVAAELPFVNAEALTKLAKEKEGYLYPDTYNFPADSNEEKVVSIMEKNFNDRLEDLASDFGKSKYTKEQIITMASLVEGEAGVASYETKQKVAGVLWRRLDIGMPIQADAVFSYIYQKHLPRVLLRHLEVDSPYNIYKKSGLPPGPIGNPSIDSIRAALSPIDTGNLFYLTGFDGKFYYAKTLSAHERNRRLHLNYNN